MSAAQQLGSLAAAAAVVAAGQPVAGPRGGRPAMVTRMRSGAAPGAPGTASGGSMIAGMPSIASVPPPTSEADVSELMDKALGAALAGGPAAGADPLVVSKFVLDTTGGRTRLRVMASLLDTSVSVEEPALALVEAALGHAVDAIVTAACDVARARKHPGDALTVGFTARAPAAAVLDASDVSLVLSAGKRSRDAAADAVPLGLLVPGVTPYVPLPLAPTPSVTALGGTVAARPSMVAPGMSVPPRTGAPRTFVAPMGGVAPRPTTYAAPGTYRGAAYAPRYTVQPGRPRGVSVAASTATHTHAPRGGTTGARPAAAAAPMSRPPLPPPASPRAPTHAL